MEIIDAEAVLLSNYEVLDFLKEEKNRLVKERKKKNKDRLMTLMLETINHLEPGPAGLQDAEHLKACVEGLQRMSIEENVLFTKNEFLQLVNLRPKTAVEIQLLIDNSEERLSEEQVDTMLNVISETLPGGEEEQEDEADPEVEDIGQDGEEGDAAMDETGEN